MTNHKWLKDSMSVIRHNHIMIYDLPKRTKGEKVVGLVDCVRIRKYFIIYEKLINMKFKVDESFRLNVVEYLENCIVFYILSSISHQVKKGEMMGIRKGWVVVVYRKPK